MEESKPTLDDLFPKVEPPPPEKKKRKRKRKPKKKKVKRTRADKLPEFQIRLPRVKTYPLRYHETERARWEKALAKLNSRIEHKEDLALFMRIAIEKECHRLLGDEAQVG